MHRACLVVMLALAGLCLPSSSARADAVADFYSGKVISLIITSGEGGYDAYPVCGHIRPRSDHVAGVGSRLNLLAGMKKGLDSRRDQLLTAG
jgi:hypothetical protein